MLNDLQNLTYIEFKGNSFPSVLKKSYEKKFELAGKTIHFKETAEDGDDEEDEEEDEEDEDEKGKSSIFTEDKLEELFSNLKINN
jgi:Ran GTPase-activating protein (RanGAP) involved in mRNA processing and transport